MLESIRTYLLTRHEIKREWIKKFDGVICLKIQGYIQKLREQSISVIPKGAGSKRYQVEGM